VDVFSLPASVVVRRAVLDDAAVLLEAEVAGDGAVCPTCGVVASRVHSRYVRRPMDLPWRGWTVRLALAVRRFRCDARACPRATFAEPIDRRLPRRARRTIDVTALLLRLVTVAGGEQGARLAAGLGVPTSPDTLLRLQRAAGAAPSPTPRVLGVDDLALRKGREYATLFVDLETRRPIDMVKGRDSAVLVQWLRDHPGVEIVVRDRAGPYADGARVGAPSAQQVADRFHLVQNASTAVEELLRGRRRALEAALTPAEPAAADAAAAGPVLSATARHDAERRAARVARWEKVHALRADGWGVMRIAREMGMIARTVNGLLASPVPPRNRQFQTRPPPLASPTLAPFAEHLRDRWAAGEHNVNQLVREIVARGYAGSTSLVQQATHAWRPPRPRPRPAAREARRFSVRWLCLRPPDTLRDDEKEALARLLAAHADLATGHALLQRFRRLVAERDPTALDAWLADARASGLAAFQALANGLVADRAAVEAALTTPWSTGPVEGHIHRVKLIKRAGYGRAKLDLLRTRVLAAA
jgi:transposase